MTTSDSISRFLDEVKEGNDEAAAAIWDRYFADLIGVARKSLVGRNDPASDEEDVVANAFKSFFKAAELGRFESLRDRDGLWRLLSQMTRRKAIDLIRQENRLKARPKTISNGDGTSEDIELLPGNVPSPNLVAIFNEECQRLLNQLDDLLLNVALKKMASYTNIEIAEQLDCSVATVERRLQLIRKKWQREIED